MRALARGRLRATALTGTVLTGAVLAGTALLSACGITPLGGGSGGSGTSQGGTASASGSARTTSPASDSSGTPGTTTARCAPARFGLASGYLAGIQFVSPQQGWAVGQRKILATTDGGRHWTVQVTGSLNLTAVDFVSAQTGWAVGASSLLATTDGGAHWASLPDPCLRSVHFVSADVGFAVAGGTSPAQANMAPASGGKALVTTDGGRTWQSLAAPADAQSLCFDNSSLGWLGAAGKLYRTADGGRSWRLVTAGAKPPSAGSVASMTVQCAGSGDAWALDIGPGAAMNQEAHIGYYASASGAVPLFAEQYFPHQGVSVTTESPGSYAGPISAISPTSAAFLDWCPACGPGTVPWALVTGTTVTREGNVGGLTQAQSASFLSPQLGWVAGTLTRFNGTSSRSYQRIVWTDNGGRAWHVLYTS
jgi:Photosynthesis system II assembly factor YCF48